MKWFPQDWISDPGLSMCDPSTRGIWADAVNIMLLSGKPFIAGSDEQLSRSLRCRPVQFQAAVAELKQFNVCLVEMQNECTRLTCRRLLREQKNKAGKQKAANARWNPECKTDANGHAPSASASASASAFKSVSEGDARGNQIRLMKENLIAMYDREPKKGLTHMEESLLFAVVKNNPDCLEEFADLRNYERSTTYFPKSISSLLSDWEKHLDAARSSKRDKVKEKSETPKSLAQKEAESLLRQARRE